MTGTHTHNGTYPVSIVLHLLGCLELWLASTLNLHFRHPPITQLLISTFHIAVPFCLSRLQPSTSPQRIIAPHSTARTATRSRGLASAWPAHLPEKNHHRGPSCRTSPPPCSPGTLEVDWSFLISWFHSSSSTATRTTLEVLDRPDRLPLPLLFQCPTRNTQPYTRTGNLTSRVYFYRVRQSQRVDGSQTTTTLFRPSNIAYIPSLQRLLIPSHRPPLRLTDPRPAVDRTLYPTLFVPSTYDHTTPPAICLMPSPGGP